MNFKTVWVVAADCRMLPYAAIDYAAYQSRPVLPAAAHLGSSFAHSWFVPQELSREHFNPNQQLQPIEPEHVFPSIDY